jgi:hypothetical protein
LTAEIAVTEKKEVSGVLVMDKLAGMTSHDVVAAVRRLLGIKQVASDFRPIPTTGPESRRRKPSLARSAGTRWRRPSAILRAA